MIIDMLSHIGERKGNVYPVESLLDIMDRAGVDKCMICSQLENIDNEYICQCAEKYPDRTLGFAVINPWEMDAEQELERYFRDYGFYGMKTNALRYGYAADRHSVLDPFFELCRRYKKIAVVHCMSDLFSLPERWAEMARSFPDVPVMLYHIGVPMMSDSAIELAVKYDNIYLSTAGAFVPVMAAALKKAGARKILFSSDAPYGDMPQEINKIRYITDNEDDLDCILFKNASDIMGIGP
jgi:predicted TIM-barrel fold metal-dependent hydrolase